MDKNQGIFVKENSIFLEANPKLDYTFVWVSWATKTKPITLSHPLPHQGLGEKTDFIFLVAVYFCTEFTLVFAFVTLWS